MIVLTLPPDDVRSLRRSVPPLEPVRDELDAALASRNALLRSAAIGLLGLVPGPEALGRLTGIATNADADASVAAVHALGRRTDGEQALLDRVGDTRLGVALAAQRSLRGLGSRNG